LNLGLQSLIEEWLDFMDLNLIKDGLGLGPFQPNRIDDDYAYWEQPWSTITCIKEDPSQTWGKVSFA